MNESFLANQINNTLEQKPRIRWKSAIFLFFLSLFAIHYYSFGYWEIDIFFDIDFLSVIFLFIPAALSSLIYIFSLYRAEKMLLKGNFGWKQLIIFNFAITAILYILAFLFTFTFLIGLFVEAEQGAFNSFALSVIYFIAAAVIIFSLVPSLVLKKFYPNTSKKVIASKMKINLKSGASIMFFLFLLEIDYFLGFFTNFIKGLNFNFSDSLNKISVLVLMLVVSVLFYFFLFLLDKKNKDENNLEWLNDFNAAMALIFYAAGFLLLRGYGLYGLKHLEIGLEDYWDFIYYGLIWFLPSILIVIKPSLFFSGAYRKIYRIYAVVFISFFLLAVGYNATKAITCDFNRKSGCVAQKALKEKDYTLCGKLKDAMDSQIHACYLVMSEKLDDISFCEKAAYDYRCVRNIAINKKERSLCELSDGGNSLFKGMCYSDYDEAISP